MEVLVPGAAVGHCDRQAVMTPADESDPGIGGRLLQWIGLVAVAAAAGVVLAFASAPATEAQAAASQSARTAQSAASNKTSTTNGGNRDPWMRKIRDLANKAKDPAVRKLAKEYLAFAEKYPMSACMSQCLFEELAKDDSPGAKSLLKHLSNCTAKCVDRDDFKRKLAEWQRDRGQREKLRRAEEAARARVSDLKRKVNEKRATQDDLDKAEKELDEAVEARKNYERSRALQDKADRLREQAGNAKTDKERERLLRAAQRKEQQAENVRNGRDRNDNGPDGTNSRDSGRAKAKVPAWMKKLFRHLGYFAIAGEILDQVQRGQMQLDERLRASLLQLHQYVEAHPYEADDLSALFRQRQLPLLDPDRMAEFLRDWDADHDDLTGDEITSECEIVSRLGGYCDPEQASQERLDPPRDRNRDTPIDDRGPTPVDDGPGDSRPDQYQPDRYQPDQYQPDRYQPDVYQPGPYEIGPADVVVAEPESGSERDDGDEDTDEKADSSRSRHDSAVSESAKSKKAKSSKTGRSTGQNTGRSTGHSTGKNTGENTGKSTGKGDSTASARDRARDELAREKSPQAKADRARDALIEDKKQVSARDKA